MVDCKKPIRFFNTQREAEKSKRKFKKYKPTKFCQWVVQGNTLVRIAKR